MASTANLEQMTVMELTTWLEQQGIPKDFCDIISGRSSYVHPDLVGCYI